MYICIYIYLFLFFSSFFLLLRRSAGVATLQKSLKGVAKRTFSPGEAQGGCETYFLTKRCNRTVNSPSWRTFQIFFCFLFRGAGEGGGRLRRWSGRRFLKTKIEGGGVVPRRRRGSGRAPGECLWGGGGC